MKRTAWIILQIRIRQENRHGSKHTPATDTKLDNKDLFRKLSCKHIVNEYME